jgi:hypothetical protein
MIEPATLLQVTDHRARWKWFIALGVILLVLGLAGMAGYALDAIEDDSRSGGSGRKRDLECQFLYFALTSEDGRWHDDAIKERFRIALLRTDQQRDQHQASVDERQRDDRRERFR